MESQRPSMQSEWARSARARTQHQGTLMVNHACSWCDIIVFKSILMSPMPLILISPTDGPLLAIKITVTRNSISEKELDL